MSTPDYSGIGGSYIITEQGEIIPEPKPEANPEPEQEQENPKEKAK